MLTLEIHTMKCFCNFETDDKKLYTRHCLKCQTYQNEKVKLFTKARLDIEFSDHKWIPDIQNKEPWNHFYSYDLFNNVKKLFPEPRYKTQGGYYTRSEIDSILNKDILFDLYINKKIDVPALVKYFNNQFSIITIYSQISKFGIPKRNMSEAILLSIDRNKETVRRKYGVDNVSKLNSIKQKKIQTTLKNYGTTHHFKRKDKVEERRVHNQERYGVDNISALDSVKESKRKTFQERYGVNNIFQLVSYIKQKIKEKYGVSNCSQLEWVKEKKFKTLIYQHDNDIAYSKQQVDLFNEVTKLFDTQISDKFKYATHGHEMFVINEYRSFSLDFSYSVDNHKFAIEYNGDLWHANPKQYKSDDKPDPFNKEITAQQIWDHDKLRCECIKNEGYELLIVWESDFVNHRQETIDKCVSFIKDQLNRN